MPTLILEKTKRNAIVYSGPVPDTVFNLNKQEIIAAYALSFEAYNALCVYLVDSDKQHRDSITVYHEIQFDGNSIHLPNKHTEISLLTGLATPYVSTLKEENL